MYRSLVSMPSSHLAAGGPHTNTLSNRVKNGKDRGFPGRVEDLEVDPGWGVGCPAVESSQFCAGHPRSDIPVRPGQTGFAGSTWSAGSSQVGRVNPGRSRGSVGLSRVGRVNPGCRVNPGLPGSSRVGRVIPGCSGEPGLAGSSRVGRVIPAQSGMTQPLVHPGSAWVDPGRAGVPGRVVPVAGSSRVWSGLSRVGRVIPRQPGPFQCSLNPAHPGHSTRPGSTRKPPVRPIFFSTVATCKYFTRTDNVPDRFSLTCWRVVNARGCFLLLRPHREEALTVVSPFSARIVRRNRKRKLVL